MSTLLRAPPKPSTRAGLRTWWGVRGRGRGKGSGPGSGSGSEAGLGLGSGSGRRLAHLLVRIAREVHTGGAVPGSSSGEGV
eukprot:scaffold10636_cov26-Phaeocystis_antarctica.AAC.1